MATASYTFDAADQIATENGVSYTYDARGNLINDGVFTYTYNALNRLVKAQTHGLTTTAVYTYNGDGLRIAQNIDGDETRFTWDQALELPQLLATSDGTRYLQGLGLEGVEKNGTWSYPLPDLPGSVRRWSDAEGGVVATADYDPYGNLLSWTGVRPAPIGYAGEWEDAATGLQYLRARWYSPAQARFTQIDPFPGIPAMPATMHPYQYGLNNPVLHTDPSGENPLLIGAAAYIGGYFAYNYLDNHTSGLIGGVVDVVGTVTGWESMQEDARRLMSCRTSGLCKALSAVDFAFNLSSGVAMFAGFFGAKGYTGAAKGLAQTGALPTEIGTIKVKELANPSRLVNSGLFRIPGSRTILAPSGYLKKANIGELTHEIVHIYQEFGKKVNFRMGKHYLNPVKLLHGLSIKSSYGIGMLFSPAYVINPTEIQAATAGLRGSLKNLELFIGNRGILLLPHIIPSQFRIQVPGLPSNLNNFLEKYLPYLSLDTYCEDN